LKADIYSNIPYFLGLIALNLVQVAVRFIKKDFNVTSDQTVLVTGASSGIGRLS